MSRRSCTISLLAQALFCFLLLCSSVQGRVLRVVADPAAAEAAAVVASDVVVDAAATQDAADAAASAAAVFDAAPGDISIKVVPVGSLEPTTSTSEQPAAVAAAVPADSTTSLLREQQWADFTVVLGGTPPSRRSRGDNQVVTSAVVADTAAATATAAGVISPMAASAFYLPSLNRHNTLRAQHVNTRALVWNDTLAARALSWSKNCTLNNEANTRTGSNTFVTASTNTSQALIDAINNWYNGSRSYNYSNPGFSQTTGAFTQLVWNATSDLGCGVSSCASVGGNTALKTVVVCRYWTAGNVATLYRQNVQPLKDAGIPLPPSPPSSPSPAPPSPSPAPPAANTPLALAQHNALRALHINTPALVWNVSLAARAQAWTNRCNWLREPGITEGSNMAASSTINTTQAVINAIQAWYNQSRVYNYSSPVPSSTTSSFTQLVWNISIELGCAVTYCPNGLVAPYTAMKTIVDCRYSPRGNAGTANAYRTRVNPLRENNIPLPPTPARSPSPKPSSPSPKPSSPSPSPGVAARVINQGVNLNSSIGSCWYSPNSVYRLCIRTTGKADLLKTGVSTPLWSSGLTFTTGAPFYLRVEAVAPSTGKLSIFNSSGGRVWTNTYAGNTTLSPFTLQIRDDGNVVVVDKNNVSRWATNTTQSK